VNDAARGCFVGLAVGDALGQPGEGLTPAAIRARWGRIEGLLDPAAAVSDDTEYALFAARVLLDLGGELTSDAVADAWLAHIVPQAGGFKGAGFSEMAAIDALRQGLRPPHTGRHYHAWSDGLAMRVAPYGVFAAGDPAEAARLARIDGLVSHDGEGIFAGEAVAAAIAAAMTAVPTDLGAVLDEALRHVPHDSWTARELRRGLAIGRVAADPWAAMEPLHDALAVRHYPWMDLGPEAVGLAWGLLAAGRGALEPTLLAAVNLGRDADTVAAIAGAVLGALHGERALHREGSIPEAWLAVLRPAEGRCLRCVAGMDLRDTADALLTLRAARRA
jgi:ADP-ribosylglycohydrolase